MSSNTTVEPPAVKKRGRPKKAVAEDAGTTTPAVDAKKAAAAANTTAAVAKGNMVEKKKEKKPPVAAKTTKPPTPVTPATSRILEQVRAKGTAWKQAQPVKPDSSSTSSGVRATTKKTATPAAAQTKPHTTQRATTIPLPRNPASAPSPIHHHPLSFNAVRSSTAKNPYPNPLRPAQPPPPPPPPQQQQQQQRPYPPAYQNTRIIEPTPDIRLPPKYKPAARRVTAIIVGLPFVIVFGYELWARWRKEVKAKFGDRVRRVEG